MCRALCAVQKPYPCRFFYVVGTMPPYLLVELDINTGEPVGSPKTLPWRPKPDGSWTPVWRETGIIETHQAIIRRP
jgi:hypothetical protein